jgi:Sulfotransferase domain
VALRVVGAGLGRTGTSSLRVALEQLLGGRCYHMSELLDRPGDTPVWHAAVHGEPVDWDGFLSEFVATVDWPACAFWRELLTANPDAIILLSRRDSTPAWWESMERTIVPTLSQPVPADDRERVRRRAMILEMMDDRFDRRWRDRDAAMAAYERHNDEVRHAVPEGQLVNWRPSDGWGPICAALGLPVPATPFPQVNTAAEFRSTQDLAAQRD